MCMTVNDLIKENRNTVIAAGNTGLNRKVTSLCFKCYNGNLLNYEGYSDMLIITNELSNISIQQIEALSKSRAAGLVVIGEGNHKITPAAKKQADEIEFPILFMSPEYRLDMSSLSLLKKQSHSKYKFFLKFHHSLNKVLLSGGNVQDIIDLLSSYLQKDTLFVDCKFYQKYPRIFSEDFRKDIDSFPLSELIERYYNHKIGSRNEDYGYLIINDSKNGLSNLERYILRQANTVLILLIQKIHSNYMIERKYKDRAVQDILFNKFIYEEEIEKLVSLHGWKFKDDITAVVLDTYNLEKYKKQRECILNKILMSSKNIIESVYPEFIYTLMGNKIIYIINECCPDENTKKKFIIGMEKFIQSFAEEIEVKIIIGIGNKKASLIDVYNSYQEAITAVRVAHNLYNQNRIVFYNELGAYKLLRNIYDTDYAQEFINTYLLPIINYDKDNNQEYFLTLKSLTRNDWDIKATAEELFIHYNTVKYRIKKLSEILGLELQNSENKISLALALKLYNLINS